jgi:serralysin
LFTSAPDRGFGQFEVVRMAAPALSTITASLLYSNQYWSGPTVTWSAAGAGSLWPDYGPGEEPSESEYAGLSAAQVLRLAAAIQTWDKIVATSFVQVADSAPGQIRVAITDVDTQSGENVWGYAYSPPFQGAGSGSGYQGDVWIDFARTSSSFAAGTYDYMVLIHELGHAIGLKHPFEDGSTLPDAYDNIVYTVMSYDDGDQYIRWTFESTGGGLRSVPNEVFASSPMVFDIAAAQQRYGADPTTASGDTVYSWSESSAWRESIYDAGGIDTFDLSTHSRGSMVDLTPGGYSDIAYWSTADQAAYWSSIHSWASSFISNALTQNAYTWSQNVGIAYSTVIENVLGGAGTDTFLGNDAANTLRGGAGGDSIAGGAGQDYLRGDDGNDYIVGGADFDDIHGNVGDDVAYGGRGGDWVVGGKDNDRLFGEDDNDIVYGNIGNDTCDGGAGDDVVRGGKDNDSVSGGAGADWVSGDTGADTLSGGTGADIFHTFGEAGIDRVMDFSRAEGDRLQLLPGSTYTVSQSGADVLIDVAGGAQMVLVGVSLSSLTGDWIFGA